MKILPFDTAYQLNIKSCFTKENSVLFGQNTALSHRSWVVITVDATWADGCDLC